MKIITFREKAVLEMIENYEVPESIKDICATQTIKEQIKNSQNNEDLKSKLYVDWWLLTRHIFSKKELFKIVLGMMLDEDMRNEKEFLNCDLLELNIKKLLLRTEEFCHDELFQRKYHYRCTS